MSGDSSASEEEDRVLVATSPHLCDLYRGYEVSLGGGSYPTIVYNLPDGKAWRKTIWPRASFPTFLQRWNIPEEIFSYLISFDCHKKWISYQVPNRPPSGTLLMYDRRKTENYRNDGYEWKTRGQSKAVREDRLKLKVKGYQLLYGCYTHSESNIRLHRRSYWLLQNPSIIIIHYLEAEGMKKASSISSPVVSTSREQPADVSEEGVEPVDLGLLTVGDKNLCRYLSLSRDLTHFRHLLHQLSLAVNQTEQVFPDVSAAIAHNNSLVPLDSSLPLIMGEEKAPLSAQPTSGPNDVSELLLRQVIEMMGMQAVSFMHGHQPLLPKGATGFISPTLLLKAASHIASTNKQKPPCKESWQNHSQSQRRPQQEKVSFSSSSLKPVLDDNTDLQPLLPPSIESLGVVMPLLDSLDPNPDTPTIVNGTCETSAGDFDSEKFGKFARSLTTLDPLRDIAGQTDSVQRLPSNLADLGRNCVEGPTGTQEECVTQGHSQSSTSRMETRGQVSNDLVEQLFMQELLSNQCLTLAHSSPSEFLSQYSLSSFSPSAHGDARAGESVSLCNPNQSPSSCSSRHSQKNQPQPIYGIQVPIPATPNSFEPSNDITTTNTTTGKSSVTKTTELASGNVDLTSLDLNLDDDSLMRLLDASESMSPLSRCMAGFESPSTLDDHEEMCQGIGMMSEDTEQASAALIPAVPEQREQSLLNGTSSAIPAQQQQYDHIQGRPVDSILSLAADNPSKFPAAPDNSTAMVSPMVPSHWEGRTGNADAWSGTLTDASMPLHDLDNLLHTKTMPVVIDKEGDNSLFMCEESSGHIPGPRADPSCLYHDGIVFPMGVSPNEFDRKDLGMDSAEIILPSFPPNSHSAVDHQFANSFLNSPQLVTGEGQHSSPASPPHLAPSVSFTEQSNNQMLPATSLDSLFLSPSTITPTADCWASSSVPSSPSVASVSSLGGAGGGDNYDYSDPPSVAELCELLSESPCVQQQDFCHLSLSNSEQQELIEASRVIQNTLRKHRDRSQFTQEKHAALLIENCYRQCKELKDQRDWAARRIQNQYRLYRRRNQELQRAVLFIQQMYRYQRNRRLLHSRAHSSHFSAHPHHLSQQH